MTDSTSKCTEQAAAKLLVHLQLLPLITGVQTVTLEEFAAIDRQLFMPVLLCKEQGPLTQAMEAQGVDVHYVPDLVRPLSPRHDLRALRQLLAQLRRLRPDILHTHSSKTGILGRLAARIVGVPVVVHTVHGFAFPFASSRLVRSIYFIVEYIGGRLCDALIVLNESDRNIATKKLKIPSHRVHLIPNGVQLSAFGRAANPERAAIRSEVFGVDDDNTLCIAMVGRLWQQKNPLCFLQAAQRVLSNTDHVLRFFFIGDGELRVELEQLIEAEGLQDNVTILGWRTDVPRLLSALDVFVLPSLWEGMPLAILEAMASSLPVIVSDIPGNNDLVINGVDGLLFESGNYQGLADQLAALIKAPALRHTLAANARKKVAYKYQLRKRLDSVMALYEQLLRLKH